MARSRVVWAGAGVAGGLVLAGLGVLLGRLGLEDADKAASVIGMFVGLLGLGVAVYSAVLARRALTSQPPSPVPGGSGQVVSGGTIGGDNIQIGQARDVNIDRRDP